MKGEWPVHKRPGNEFLCIRRESRETDRENSSNEHGLSAGWIRNPISLNVFPLTGLAVRVGHTDVQSSRWAVICP